MLLPQVNEGFDEQYAIKYHSGGDNNEKKHDSSKSSCQADRVITLRQSQKLLKAMSIRKCVEKLSNK